MFQVFRATPAPWSRAPHARPVGVLGHDSGLVIDAVHGIAIVLLDMCSTCDHVVRMSTMIQLRNVPDALHRKLKARAALAGQSLSDYLLAELKLTLERPTREEFLARLASRTRNELALRPADAVRDERDAR